MNWPVHLRNSAEGGMVVFALTVPPSEDDGFVNCCDSGCVHMLRAGEWLPPVGGVLHTGEEGPFMSWCLDDGTEVPLFHGDDDISEKAARIEESGRTIVDSVEPVPQWEQSLFGSEPTVTSATKTGAAAWDPTRHTTVDLRSAVCLGTSGGSWTNTDADGSFVDYWTCGLGDLTGDGRALVDLLEKLAGVPVSLVTVLDT